MRFDEIKVIVEDIWQTKFMMNYVKLREIREKICLKKKKNEKKNVQKEYSKRHSGWDILKVSNKKWSLPVK